MAQNSWFPLDQVSHFFTHYSWEGAYHRRFGYPPDSYPEFRWITSLESRFAYIRSTPGAVPLHLIRELIMWGGNQNGVLSKFDRQLGDYSLADKFAHLLESLSDPETAITVALQIPGIGLTYASKLLRFMAPEDYGALDGRVRRAIEVSGLTTLPTIYDGHRASEARGFVSYTSFLRKTKDDLQASGITNPMRESWKAGQIEMALFSAADQLLNRNGKETKRGSAEK